jgi:hypothetical protein
VRFCFAVAAFSTFARFFRISFASCLSSTTTSS